MLAPRRTGLEGFSDLSLGAIYIAAILLVIGRGGVSWRRKFCRDISEFIAVTLPGCQAIAAEAVLDSGNILADLDG